MGEDAEEEEEEIIDESRHTAAVMWGCGAATSAIMPGC